VNLQMVGAADRSESPPDMSGLADSIRMPDIKIPKNVLVENAQANLASAFHNRLVQWIKKFDASLDDQHEVGVRLVNFGQAVVFHLEDLGYYNPSLISFTGKTEDGDPVELIQHVSQISILLMKLPRQDMSQPKRRFGFHSVSQESDDQSPAGEPS
jgi:hypothetical protein